MTDDIVTRLREIKRDAVLMWDEKETIDEATDEIKRLRGDVLKYKALHEACKEHHSD